MAILDSVRPVHALNELLDKEHDSLLKYDFATLSKVLLHKEKLMVMVAKSNAPQKSLTRLKRKADRNSRLLSASARGLKNARTRIQNLRNTPKTFNSYGPNGCATSIGNKSLTMKRKA